MEEAQWKWVRLEWQPESVQALHPLLAFTHEPSYHMVANQYTNKIPAAAYTASA